MAKNVCLSVKQSTGRMEILWTGGGWLRGPGLAVLPLIAASRHCGPNSVTTLDFQEKLEFQL